MKPEYPEKTPNDFKQPTNNFAARSQDREVGYETETVWIWVWVHICVGRSVVVER